ncbi:MAG: cyclic pyranopterin monophosphate synthase MoaC [Clostridiales bacterium]
MDFTHLDEKGRASMVEITDKEETKRLAVACGKILMKSDTINKIKTVKIEKGDVLSVAQIAGIMGAKKTSDIVPMCHPLMLTGINLELTIEDYGIYIESTVKTYGKTGVEMEALTAISITALTIYDMCKSVDKNMKITDIYLKHKNGGKSGEYNHKLKI